MTNDERIERQRELLNVKLEGIVELSREITAELSGELVKSRAIRRFLKPKSGAYIISTPGSEAFMSEYHDAQGSVYIISVEKRE